MPAIVPSGSDKVISRHDLLKWINQNLSVNYKKIEELNTGVAYCQLIENLMPGSVIIKRIKTTAKVDHEYIHNFRLLQCAFMKHNIDKIIPIEKLIKGKFQDNYEFLQWFKKFYDLNVIDNENHNRTYKQSSEKIEGVGKLKLSNSKTSTEINNPNEMTVSSTGILKPDKNERSSSVSPGNCNARTEHINELLTQISTLRTERDLYYKKIKQIEGILQTDNYTNVIKQVNDIVSGAVSHYDLTHKNKKRRVSFNV